jgi:hypothetical protein
MTQRIFAAVLGAAILGAAIIGGLSAPANAAELGPVPGWRARHVRISQTYWNWLDRCAYAGYYCLYAEHRYVYHYPFDDRPIAYTHYRRSFR